MTRLIFQSFSSKFLYVDTIYPLEIRLMDDNLHHFIHESIEFYLTLTSFLSSSPHHLHHPITSSQQRNYHDYFQILRINNEPILGSGGPGPGGVRKIMTTSAGKCSLEIKFVKLSFNIFPCSQFQFIAIPSSPSSSSSLSSSCCCGISEPFSCIQYRLVISNLHQLPSIWYKDQSYRKSHVIHIQIQLHSSTGIVKGLVVPLKIQVRYCGKDGAIEILPIPDQKILKISSPKSSTLVISQKGTCNLECTFTQVSSRHYHRNFAFYLEADPSYANSKSISPVEFGNIEVRSKVWKGKKKEIDPLIEDSSPAAALSTPDHVHNSNIFPSTRRSLKRTVDQRSDGIDQTEDCEISLPLTQHLEGKRNKSHHSPTFKSPLLDFQPEDSFFADIFDMNHRKNSNNLEIIEWIHKIMRQIKDLKWREVGRESIPCQSSDGNQIQNVCQSVPLYDMPFPNRIIDQIIESYSNFFPDTLLSSDSFPSHSHSSSQPVTDLHLTTPENRSGSSASGVSHRDSDQTPFYHHTSRQGRSLNPSATYIDPFLPLSSKTSTSPQGFRRSNSLGPQSSIQRPAFPLFAISEDTKGEKN